MLSETDRIKYIKAPAGIPQGAPLTAETLTRLTDEELTRAFCNPASPATIRGVNQQENGETDIFIQLTDKTIHTIFITGDNIKLHCATIQQGR